MKKNTWDELWEQRESILNEADAIIEKALEEKRSMTDEEQSSYDAKVAEAKRLDEMAERLKEKAKRDQAAEPVIEPNHEPPKQKVQVGVDRRTLEPWAEGSRGFGEYLQAVVRALSQPYSSVDPRLMRAALGAGEAVPGDGGFLVQQDVAQRVLQKMNSYGMVAGRCQVVPISTNSNSIKIPAVNETSRADGSRGGGVRAYWVDEGASITASKPTFSQVELHLHKLAALMYASDEVLSDASALGALAEELFARELAFELDNRIINGTGAGQPLGVLNAACLVSVTKETGQASTTFLYENAVKMYARLNPSSLAGAAWFVNQDVLPQLFVMSLAVGTGGAPVYMPAGNAAGRPFATLLGLPVIPIEQAKTLGTAGDVILADFGQYLLARKGMIQADSSIHVQFTTDQIAFRYLMRVDGQPWWSAALTPANGSNTLSPFVVVASR